MYRDSGKMKNALRTSAHSNRRRDLQFVELRDSCSIET